MSAKTFLSAVITMSYISVEKRTCLSIFVLSCQVFYCWFRTVRLPSSVDWLSRMKVMPLPSWGQSGCHPQVSPAPVPAPVRAQPRKLGACLRWKQMVKGSWHTVQGIHNHMVRGSTCEKFIFSHDICVFPAQYEVLITFHWRSLVSLDAKLIVPWIGYHPCLPWIMVVLTKLHLRYIYVTL